MAEPYFNEALSILDAKIKEQPEDAGYYSSLGIAYAGLGHKKEATVNGQKGAEKLPFTKDACRAQDRLEDLARIYVMVGEFDAAIDELRSLLDMPGDLSVSLLRLDPAWKPLRGHARFIELVKDK